MVRHRELLFGKVSEDQARDLADQEVIQTVADRVWLIVLSNKQETLVPLLEWRAVVEAELVRKGKTW